MPFDFKKYDEKCAAMNPEELQREWQHYTRLISGASTSTAVSGLALPLTCGVSVIGVGMAAPAIHNARKKREIIEKHLQRYGTTHHTRKRDVLGSMAFSGTIGVVTLGVGSMGTEAIASAGAEHGISAIVENETAIKIVSHAALDGAGMALEHAYTGHKKASDAHKAFKAAGTFQAVADAKAREAGYAYSHYGQPVVGSSSMAQTPAPYGLYGPTPAPYGPYNPEMPPPPYSAVGARHVPVADTKAPVPYLQSYGAVAPAAQPTYPYTQPVQVPASSEQARLAAIPPQPTLQQPPIQTFDDSQAVRRDSYQVAPPNGTQSQELAAGTHSYPPPVVSNTQPVQSHTIASHPQTQGQAWQQQAEQYAPAPQLQTPPGATRTSTDAGYSVYETKTIAESLPAPTPAPETSRQPQQLQQSQQSPHPPENQQTPTSTEQKYPQQPQQPQQAEQPRQLQQVHPQPEFQQPEQAQPQQLYQQPQPSAEQYPSPPQTQPGQEHPQAQPGQSSQQPQNASPEQPQPQPAVQDPQHAQQPEGQPEHQQRQPYPQPVGGYTQEPQQSQQPQSQPQQYPQVSAQYPQQSLQPVQPTFAPPLPTQEHPQAQQSQGYHQTHNTQASQPYGHPHQQSICQPLVVAAVPETPVLHAPRPAPAPTAVSALANYGTQPTPAPQQVYQPPTPQQMYQSPHGQPSGYPTPQAPAQQSWYYPTYQATSRQSTGGSTYSIAPASAPQTSYQPAGYPTAPHQASVQTPYFPPPPRTATSSSGFLPSPQTPAVHTASYNPPTRTVPPTAQSYPAPGAPYTPTPPFTPAPQAQPQIQQYGTAQPQGYHATPGQYGAQLYPSQSQFPQQPYQQPYQQPQQYPSNNDPYAAIPLASPAQQTHQPPQQQQPPQPPQSYAATSTPAPAQPGYSPAPEQKWTGQAQWQPQGAYTPAATPATHYAPQAQGGYFPQA